MRATPHYAQRKVGESKCAQTYHTRTDSNANKFIPKIPGPKPRAPDPGPKTPGPKPRAPGPGSRAPGPRYRAPSPGPRIPGLLTPGPITPSQFRTPTFCKLAALALARFALPASLWSPLRASPSLQQRRCSIDCTWLAFLCVCGCVCVCECVCECAFNGPHERHLCEIDISRRSWIAELLLRHLGPHPQVIDFKAQDERNE